MIFFTQKNKIKLYATYVCNVENYIIAKKKRGKKKEIYDEDEEERVVCIL